MWTSDLLGGTGSGAVLWRGIADVRLQVNHYNVMAAAQILLDEAQRFRAIVAARFQAMRVSAPGGDPVSVVAARVVNERFWAAPDSFVNRCLDYADMLDSLADQMAEAARTYGYTEETIEAVFSSRGRDYAQRPSMPGDWSYRRQGRAIDGPRIA